MTDATIRIDRDRCMGSGSCMFHAPDTFDVDDDGKAVLIGDGDGDGPDAVRAAVEGCPTQALSLTA